MTLQFAVAQTISPQVINSTGRTFQTSNGGIDYNIGEPITGFVSNGGNQITQGFLQPSSSITSSQTEIACDSLSWNGQTYTASGVYTYTTTNSEGSDSVVTLYLTINLSTSSYDTVLVCDTYTWLVDGNTYNTSGTYTHTGVNASGCQHLSTLILTVNSLSVTALASGTINCFGESIVVDVTANDGVYPYSGTGSFMQSAGTQVYIVTDVNGCTGSSSVTLTEPSKVEGITSSTASICALNNGTASVSATGGTGPYTLLWSDGQTNSTATGLASGNYSVTITDSYTCTGSAMATVSGSGVSPDPTGPVIGPSGVCRNQSGTVFSVSPVSGATDYSWSLPPGASGLSSTNSITVSFDNTYAGGFICVAASNSCSTSANACLNLPVITVRPTQPGFIIGDPNPCGPNIYSYSINPSINASSYVWKVAGSGMAIMSGQGTNSIQVSVPAGFGQGNVSVRAENCIGITSTRTLTLTGIPAHSNTLVGKEYVCAGTISEPYSISSVNGGGNSYNWTTTGDMTIASTNGRFCNVNFGSSFTTGTLNITTSSSCGSFTKTYTIRSTPPQPGSITGPGSNLCSLAGITYGIAPIASATTYNWTVPAGISITANTGTSITVDIESSFTGSGNICVTANNTCGASIARCYRVSVLPSVPISITGPASVCKASSTVSYTTPSVSGATHYSWFSNNGVVLTTIGTGLSATADFRFATSSSTTLTVRANNNCGIGQPFNKIVSVDVNCRDVKTLNQIFEKTRLYPNPSNGKITLDFFSENPGDFTLRVMDILGQTLISSQNNSSLGLNTKEIDLSSLAKGVYMIGLKLDGNSEELLKLIKE